MREAALWTFCATIVAVAHVAAWLLFATPRVTVDSDAGSPVVTVELSPIVTAPAPPPEDARSDALTNTAPPPPGAQAAEVRPLDLLEPPKQDLPKATPPPSPEPPPIADQAAVSPDPLPVAPTPAPDTPPPLAEQPLAQAAAPVAELPTPALGAPPAPPPSAPSTVSNHVADVEAAPAKAPGSEEAVAPPILRRWRQELIRQIERHKHYPADAKGVTGVAKVAFAIDPTGRLISVSIAASSGSPVLDEAAIDLIRRAEPFPPPPPNLGAGELTFIAPIRYLGAAGRRSETPGG
jgi:periplasmic protein TonB